MVRRKAKTKRRRTRARRRKPRALMFFLFSILLVAASAYICSLPIWKINDVVVNGAQMLEADEIRTLASVPLSENLFYTSFARARANLAKIPAIESFRIYRIPPGTVLISITERKPLATMVFPKRSLIIDKEGYLLNLNPNMKLNISNMADLPVISGVNEKTALQGNRVSRSVAQIVLNIVAKLSYFLESRSMQIQLGSLQDVSFLLDDLLYVRVGDAEDIKRKMEVFEALLPEIAGKWTRVEYVDVRYPDNPVIMYK